MNENTIPEMGLAMIGPGPLLQRGDLTKFIHDDVGLPLDQRVHLLRILNSPNVAEQLVAGGMGAALALTIARWKKMGPTNQVLMSLAGFGLGNIILNKLTQPGKYTEWDPEKGTNKIIL
jgi:hypothetical protein